MRPPIRADTSNMAARAGSAPRARGALAPALVLAIMTISGLVMAISLRGAESHADTSTEARALRAELGLLAALEQLAKEGGAVPATDLTTSLEAIDRHLSEVLPAIDAPDREQLAADVEGFSESAALAAMAYSIGDPEAGAAFDDSTSGSLERLHDEFDRIGERARQRSDHMQTIAFGAAAAASIGMVGAALRARPPLRPA